MSGFYARLWRRRGPTSLPHLDCQQPEEFAAWAHNSIDDAWFGEWQQEGRVEQFFLVPNRHRPVDELLTDLWVKFDRLEEGQGARPRHPALPNLGPGRPRGDDPSAASWTSTPSRRRRARSRPTTATACTGQIKTRWRC